jgi:nitrogen regulatory protein P-II 1
MKEIRAVIRPNKLPKLRASLRDLPGFPGMTVTKVEGFGAPAQHAMHNIREQLTDYVPKVRIEIVTDDSMVAAILERIVAAAGTGQIGDGLVWVTDVEQAIFIYKTTAPGSSQG